MPTLISFKRKMSSSDEWYNPQLGNNYTAYKSNGARGVSWGGSFATNVLSYLRTAKSHNSNYDSFTTFRILSQSSVVNRIGYQVIYDPVTFRDGDVEFQPDRGVVIKDNSSPWDVYSDLGAGRFTTTEISSVFDLTPEIYNGRDSRAVWAVDSDGNFAYWYWSEGRWANANTSQAQALIFAWTGTVIQGLGFYFIKNGWYTGTEALNGRAPWTPDYLIPGK